MTKFWLHAIFGIMHEKAWNYAWKNLELCMKKLGNMHEKTWNYAWKNLELCMKKLGIMHEKTWNYAWKNLELCMNTWKVLWKLKHVCCMQILYVAEGNFVKFPRSSQIFMRIEFYIYHVETCKQCQATYKNMLKLYAISSRDHYPLSKCLKNPGYYRNLFRHATLFKMHFWEILFFQMRSRPHLLLLLNFKKFRPF